MRDFCRGKLAHFKIPRLGQKNKRTKRNADAKDVNVDSFASAPGADDDNAGLSTWSTAFPLLSLER